MAELILALDLQVLCNSDESLEVDSTKLIDVIERITIYILLLRLGIYLFAYAG
jgi:hypothetical protein